MGVNGLSKTVTPTASRLRFEPGPFHALVQHANHSARGPPSHTTLDIYLHARQLRLTKQNRDVFRIASVCPSPEYQCLVCHCLDVFAAGNLALLSLWGAFFIDNVTSNPIRLLRTDYTTEKHVATFTATTLPRWQHGGVAASAVYDCLDWCFVSIIHKRFASCS